MYYHLSFYYHEIILLFLISLCVFILPAGASVLGGWQHSPSGVVDFVDVESGVLSSTVASS